MSNSAEEDNQMANGESSDDEPDHSQSGPEVLVMDADDEMDELQDEDEQQQQRPSDDSLVKVEAHQKDVFCLAVSPDGRWLASGSEDDTAAIWDLQQQTPEPSMRIAGKHTDTVHYLAWNGNSTLLASGDMAGRIVVLSTTMQVQGTEENYLIIDDCQPSSNETPKNGEPAEEEDSFEHLRWLHWHPSAEGILFAGAGDGSLWMWLVSKQPQGLGVLQSKIYTSNTAAPCVGGKLLTDARHLLAAYEDSTARLWNLKECSSADVQLPAQCTGAMDLDGKAGVAAIGCINGMAALLGTNTTTAHQQNSLRLLHTFTATATPRNENSQKSDAEENSVECVRFAPGDLPWLAVGTASGVLAIFDWERRSMRYECGHDGEAVVSCIWRVSPADSTISLISACIDSGIRVWDARSGQPQTLFSGGGDEIFSLASREQADGKCMLFTGCAGGLIRVFQL